MPALRLPANLGLCELVHQHLDLGDARGRVDTGDRLMTLVASALAWGDSFDDADGLRPYGVVKSSFQYNATGVGLERSVGCVS